MIRGEQEEFYMNSKCCVDLFTWIKCKSPLKPCYAIQFTILRNNYSLKFYGVIIVIGLNNLDKMLNKLKVWELGKVGLHAF